jgi:hypothetical protein
MVVITLVPGCPSLACAYHQVVQKGTHIYCQQNMEAFLSSITEKKKKLGHSGSCPALFTARTEHKMCDETEGGSALFVP